MLNLRQLTGSFRYALKGLSYVYRHEQNFRVQSLASLLVIIAMVVLRVERHEMIILLMLIIFVLTLEIANAIVEKLMDVLQPRLHMYVKVIKDMTAGAVLISAVGSAIIGGIIFIPKILELLSLN